MATLPLWDCLHDPLPDFVGGVLAIGNFDGVHRGHCRLLANLRDMAARASRPAIAVTFHPHPLAILRPESAPDPILWPERKEELLLAGGADRVLFCRSSPELLQLSADEFFAQVVVQKLRACGMVEGPNFGFGRGRAGDIHLLTRLCQVESIDCRVVDVVQVEHEGVSSSRIRKALEAGDVALAGALLGRPHRIRGTVARGDGRGRGLGFPTANIEQIDVLVPAASVYACRAKVGGRWWPAAVNIGPNPTFGVERNKVEAHLLDFHGDLYGEQVELDFLTRIRGVERFSGPEALRARLKEDVAETRRWATMAPPDRPQNVLAQTIHEWLKEQFPAESACSRIEQVALSDHGVLRIDWSAGVDKAPGEAWNILFTLEERLRRVFPAVQRVESWSPRPDEP